MQLNYLPWAKSGVGKFKPPVGLERLQSDDDTSFVERGLPTLLVPQRDIGFQLRPTCSTAGVAISSASSMACRTARSAPIPPSATIAIIAARIFLTPFLPDEGPAERAGLRIRRVGRKHGWRSPAGLQDLWATDAFFTFASGVTAAGHRTRLDPQAYYYLGSFGLLTEYALNEEGFQKSSVRREIAFRAYQVEASTFSPERRRASESHAAEDLRPAASGGWGAVELAVRLGDWEAEKGLYNYGLASDVTTPRAPA